MTVSTTTDRVTVLGDGATTTFSFPFPAVDPSFIFVTLTDPSGTVSSIDPSLFTVLLNPPVAPNPTSIGGTVTYPISGPALAVGNSLLIVRMLPPTQSVSIANQSIVYPAVIEQEFDYLTMLRQTSAGDISRAFQVPPSDPPPALVPPVLARANMFAFFDASGNLTATSGGGGGGGGTVISAAMIPVVTAATLPLAQVAMGVAPTVSPTFTGTPVAPTPPTPDTSTKIATTAYVQAVVAGTVGATVFTTGDLKPTHKTVADTGWIMWVDGTIGDATSGSSIRANADTNPLFALYYNSYSDTNCPLLTSGGASTTRAIQGPVATAFAAHCRITLPRGPGRALGISGTGAGLTARTLGSWLGAQTHTQTLAELVIHNHTIVGASSGATVNPLAEFDPNGNADFSGGRPNGVEISAIQNAGGGDPMNIMNPTTYINVMVKL